MENAISIIEIFNNVNKWLEFSERKNAFIFSFFSLMAIFTPLINKLAGISSIMKIGIVVFYTLYIISIIFTLASFFPTSNISKYIIKNGRDKKIRSDDNLLFWGHIYKYSRDEYKSKLEEKYKIKYDNQEYINDLIDQIIINSNITNTKFKFFKISVILAVIAIVQFTIFFIVDILI